MYQTKGRTLTIGLVGLGLGVGLGLVLLFSYTGCDNYFLEHVVSYPPSQCRQASPFRSRWCANWDAAHQPFVCEPCFQNLISVASDDHLYHIVFGCTYHCSFPGLFFGLKVIRDCTPQPVSSDPLCTCSTTAVHVLFRIAFLPSKRCFSLFFNHGVLDFRGVN